MDNIPTVTLSVAVEEHVECQPVCFAVTMAYSHAAPQFIENGSCSKSAKGKADIGCDIEDTDKRQNDGTCCCENSRHAQIAPQGFRRSAPPGQQGSDSHCEDQGSK